MSIRRLSFDLVAGADGTFPTVATPPIVGTLLALETDPADRIADFDVRLFGDGDIDELFGSGLGRAGGDGERVVIRTGPGEDSTYHPFVVGRRTLVVSGLHPPGSRLRVGIIYA